MIALGTVDLKKRAEDLENLLSIVKAMAVEKDLDQLLELIIHSITRVLDAERSSLFLYDEKTNELYSRIAEKSEIGEIRFPVGQGIAGEAAQNLSVINIEDAYEDGRFNPAIDRQTGFRTRSVLCRPLLTHEDRLIGVIQVLNSHKERFDEYDEELLYAFSTHAAIALDSARLIQEYLEKKQIEQSLELAREIQQGLLPKEAPTIEGFEMAGMSLPADDTGGDYYDCIAVGDDRWLIAVGDVTGHGIGPALLAAATRSYIRSAVKAACADTSTDIDLGRVMTHVNTVLAEDLPDERFVTLILALLDPKARRLTFASAGHEEGLHLPAGSDEFVRLGATGLPLGIIDDVEYEEGPPCELSAGDVVVLTTDGIAEAHDPNHGAFGAERLEETIKDCRDASAKELLATLHQRVIAFRGSEAQADDYTIVAMRAL